MKSIGFILAVVLLFGCGVHKKRHWFISYHGHTLSDNEAWGTLEVTDYSLPPMTKIFTGCVLTEQNLDSARISATQIFELSEEDYISITSQGTYICK